MTSLEPLCETRTTPTTLSPVYSALLHGDLLTLSPVEDCPFLLSRHLYRNVEGCPSWERVSEWPRSWLMLPHTVTRFHFFCISGVGVANTPPLARKDIAPAIWSVDVEEWWITLALMPVSRSPDDISDVPMCRFQRPDSVTWVALQSWCVLVEHLRKSCSIGMTLAIQPHLISSC